MAAREIEGKSSANTYTRHCLHPGCRSLYRRQAAAGKERNRKRFWYRKGHGLHRQSIRREENAQDEKRAERWWIVDSAGAFLGLGRSSKLKQIAQTGRKGASGCLERGSFPGCAPAELCCDLLLLLLLMEGQAAVSATTAGHDDDTRSTRGVICA